MKTKTALTSKHGTASYPVQTEFQIKCLRIIVADINATSDLGLTIEVSE